MTVAFGDSLRGFATVHLGSEDRWPEIYDINRDLIQADGRALADPDLVRTGWVLRIPAA